ncbi:MAG: amino acid ABC transporter ATP-binding protein [Gaiellales bacterium]|jgi:polar amino acid transport system ATP-binding protein|nr:amino acid ABC transporter ATP-binding protein [Gaiellales bacterium]
MSTPVLEIQGVTKQFDDKHVLQGIDLKVAEHTAVVMIGASGSGKSTLLRCINLLVDIDDGDILLDGEVVTDPTVDPQRVRRSLAMVFQHFNLFPHMNVLDQITLAPVKAHRIPKAEAVDEARALLARFGLADRERDYPDQLSGGQQQRVALIRAIATRPRALLLDEITSALDPELVGEVLEVVRELKEGGMTMLIATHEMAFARDVADEVCFLHQGRVVERGTGRQMIEDPQEAETQKFLARMLATRAV